MFQMEYAKNANYNFLFVFIVVFDTFQSCYTQVKKQIRFFSNNTETEEEQESSSLRKISTVLFRNWKIIKQLDM